MSIPGFCVESFRRGQVFLGSSGSTGESYLRLVDEVENEIVYYIRLDGRNPGESGKCSTRSFLTWIHKEFDVEDLDGVLREFVPGDILTGMDDLDEDSEDPSVDCRKGSLSVVLPDQDDKNLVRGDSLGVGDVVEHFGEFFIVTESDDDVFCMNLTTFQLEDVDSDGLYKVREANLTVF